MKATEKYSSRFASGIQSNSGELCSKEFIVFTDFAEGSTSNENNSTKIVHVIIEIEKHSNQKWEYDRKNDTLFLDRVLKYPYFYPYAYGFFPNTLGNDGDELDALLITNRIYKKYTEEKTTIECCIVGGLMMRDEKGVDEKIFVVPKDEFEEYKSKSELEKRHIEDDIVWFFSNYKSKEDDRWSFVDYVLDTPEAIGVYKSAKYAHNV